MGIIDSGACHLYISPESSFQNANPTAPKVCAGTPNSHIEQSAATANLSILQPIKYFTTNFHIMPYFKYTLVGLGTICDVNCTVSFPKKYVVVFLLIKNPFS